MRAPVLAIGWEIWAANRRGWLLLATAIPVCAVLYRSLADALRRSDELRSLSFIPMIVSLVFVMAFNNFTERGTSEAGFPMRMFTLPVRTRVLVAGPMAFGVASVLIVYVAWAGLVLQPAGIEILIRWPATLLAAGMVFYQAIIWSLSGFRFTRLIVLAVVLSHLVALGVLPHALTPANQRPWEWALTALLAVLMLAAYAVAVAAVQRQRRGGGRGGRGWHTLLQRLEDAMPRRQRPFASPEGALLWLEWCRGGLVLPVSVMCALLLIIGPCSWIAGRGPEATAHATLWIALLPVILAIPIGKGLAKPDFWSLDLELPPFLCTRPITDGQIVAAKLKSAALSTLLAWAILLTVATAWLWLACDNDILHSHWKLIVAVYSPLTRWALPPLLIIAAVVLTWRLMIGSLWTGLSGRPALFAGSAISGLLCCTGVIAFFVWWTLDQPGARARAFVTLLPWVPWLMAVAVLVKAWLALFNWRRATRRNLVSDRAARNYSRAWGAATGCFMFLAWILSPRVEWFRDILFLMALLLVPLARLGAAPLTLNRNRHR